MKKNRRNYWLLPFILGQLIAFSQSKHYQVHTVAFYNFENLFDTINDKHTFDEEWTPEGEQQWNTSKYQQKLKNDRTIS